MEFRLLEKPLMIRKANNGYPVWDWPGSTNWIRSSGKSGLTVGRLIVGVCKQMIRKIVIPGSNSWTNDLDRGNRCFLSSMLAVFSYMNTSTRSGIGSQSNRAWSVLRSLSWSKHR